VCMVASLFLQLLRWSLGRSRAKETSGLLERMSPNFGVTGGEDPQVALAISLVEDIGDSGRVSTIIEGISIKIVGNNLAVDYRQNIPWSIRAAFLFASTLARKDRRRVIAASNERTRSKLTRSVTSLLISVRTTKSVNLEREGRPVAYKS